MITLVEALNYRCLRYVRRPLQSFHVLVGPNASGKTTFLDVIGFLRDVVSNGLDGALVERTPTPVDLLFQRQGERVELAVEAEVPERLRQRARRPDLDVVRYQVAIGFDDTHRQFEFKAETLLLKKRTAIENKQRQLSFPLPIPPPASLLVSIRRQDNKVLLNKVLGGNDNFYDEAKPPDKSWAPSFKLGPRRSALGNLPADESAFPVATWFRDYLHSGVQRFMLNSRAIRRPSPPTRVSGFLPDGSNVPWVVARLRQHHPERHAAWIKHLRTALPDLVDISTIERPEDRHCYLSYEYGNQLTVPSWLVSDGTLRLTALTLPAYLTDLQGNYLIEEPENGIHPGAVAAVYDSLSSVYGTQVLLATHSPVVLNAAAAGDVLCFAKDEEGATDIVLGSEHPICGTGRAMRIWGRCWWRECRGEQKGPGMISDTSERGLERFICTALAGHPCDPLQEGRTREARPAYGGVGWSAGDARDYDREFCVDLLQLAAFLHATQPDAAEALTLDADGPTRRKFLARIQSEISRRGTVDVLRHGIRHGPHDLSLFYGAPSPGNRQAQERFAQNRFTVVRQLRYSRDETQRALDIGLFIDGLPVFTFELKNRLTKQTAADAVEQYRRDRNPREKLFEPCGARSSSPS